MAEIRERGHVGALISKLESKICYHRDATLEYMEIKTVIDKVVEEKEKLQHVNMEVLDMIYAVTEQKEKLQHDHYAMEENLVVANKKIVEVNKELAARKEEISQNKKKLELVKKKIQVKEAKNNQTERQYGCASEPIHPTRVQTRSMKKRKVPSEGPLGNDADKPELLEEHRREELVNNPIVGQTPGVSLSTNGDLEALREHLIKEFLEIDKNGGRNIGIKEMGGLNLKAFEAACLAKLPPAKAAAATRELYSSWQQQLRDLSWNPFDAVTVEGNHQETLNVDDDKLQELKSVVLL